MPSDAAALPSPPGRSPWKDSRPYSVGGTVHTTSPSIRPDSGGGGTRPVPPPRFPNIKDLQDQAALLNVSEHSSIEDLLGVAAAAFQQSRVLADGVDIDRAYIQYLRASEITINLIPQHPGYPTIQARTPELYKQFAALMMSVRSKQATMDTIKQEIIEDNLRSNVQPTRAHMSTSLHNSGPDRNQENNRPFEASTRMPSPTQFQQTAGLERDDRRLSAATADSLAERFARLKTLKNADGTGVNAASSPVQALRGSSDQFFGRARNTVTTTQTSATETPYNRPLGPRTMDSSTHFPSVPPKVPINTSMPRAPDPAYSPIYTVPNQPPPSNPPGTSAESARSLPQRYSQLANSPRESPSRSTDDHTYRTRTPNGGSSSRETRSNSPDLPYNTHITAHDLMDYLRRFSVLVIDVRPRDQFDLGHIYAKSVICVEPIVLKENVSAEELEERLVVSPDYEQALFERRNEFDLVVYYDQQTASVSYLAGSPVGTSAPHLRALHDTLYEFNEYKPLKAGRPPALLLGGLDAWIDLVGPQSLATSSTAAVMGSLQSKRTRPRPGKPLGRVPTMASANSSFEVRKRRLREFTPLNSEELSAWLERSRKEEIDTSHYLEEESVPEDDQELDDGEPPTPLVHSYEAFLRRFPEPHQLQQSMMHPDSRRSVDSASRFSAPVPMAPLRPPPAVSRPSYSGVSDGRHAQPHVQRQNSANRAPLYTSSSYLSRLKLPRTGLHNFGVTCYMNSTLQCLNATVMMSKFFIDDRYRHYVQKNWKGSQGVMPGLYANLIRSLWKGDVEVIMPSSFRNFCGRLNREWAIDRQQDAKEFFDFLVDCLHEDLNINWQRNPLRPLTTSQEMQRERMPVQKVSEIEWNRYSHREDSFISSLFAGQHASRLKCTTCRQTSTTYEAFYSISVEIPTEGTGDIYQCLRSYCQEEMLSGDEVWKCPHCKCDRIATKQIIVTRAPQILVVHFKRFSASKTQSARKIHTPIEFPLHGLRMDDYIVPYPQAKSSGDSGLGSSTGPATPPFTYDAFGVLRHIGSSMGSGHYVSLVRDAERQCWRKFDDDRVTDFSPRDLRPRDRLQNEQAYIVFYERVPAK
ncbi:Ubiquitin carboxyl-terminal hydrolase [Penicillium ucsense]|uniref:Ubiquitin carboxyl-terminal hydrolase n=1 Tax=Penicillium ucsense TaxID=2839758 RepID=A0A8J8W7Z5_9EURO|nr:Ubiquitin carboxyl-terminal hydrolase [Penicillium ucsense]KAF7734667.1 Ubiquitin carboxyl-terminal hydrolase [Penicillium ucsense]